jgi:hypothetical protein
VFFQKGLIGVGDGEKAYEMDGWTQNVFDGENNQIGFVAKEDGNLGTLYSEAMLSGCWLSTVE